MNTFYKAIEQVVPQVGYMMRHRTGSDVGFSWNKDDPQFDDNWERIEMSPTPARSSGQSLEAAIMARIAHHEAKLADDSDIHRSCSSTIVSELRKVLASQPPAPQATNDDEIEKRTEEIRLRHALPEHATRKQILFDVECLLAHIAVLSTKPAQSSGQSLEAAILALQAVVDSGGTISSSTFEKCRAALASQPAAPQASQDAGAVGEVTPMPGTSGFTMAAFKTSDVPVGTKLYTAPAATMPSAAPSGWISVDERLPEFDVDVLVWGDGVAIERWTEYHEDPIGMGGPTICTGEGWENNEWEGVSHWMPLPAAPASPLGGAE